MRLVVLVGAKFVLAILPLMCAGTPLAKLKPPLRLLCTAATLAGLAWWLGPI